MEEKRSVKSIFWAPESWWEIFNEQSMLKAQNLTIFGLSNLLNSNRDWTNCSLVSCLQFQILHQNQEKQTYQSTLLTYPSITKAAVTSFSLLVFQRKIIRNSSSILNLMLHHRLLIHLNFLSFSTCQHTSGLTIGRS